MSRSISLVAPLLPLVLVAEAVDTAWVRGYNGVKHGHDWATCLAADSRGNVYVAGASAADTGYVNLDYVVIKYRPNGDVGWHRRYDFAGDDIPYNLGVDADGNVYVTGSGGGRTATIKYDSIGRLVRFVWLRTLGNQGQGNGLVLDGNRNVLLCGAALGKSFKCETAKYRPQGETAWVRFSEEGGNALAVDEHGGPAIVGSCLDSVPMAPCLTLKYDSSGVLLWVARHVGSSEAEYLDYVGVDGSGNVCAVGSSSGVGTGRDYLTIKYSPQGETVWTRRCNGPANDRDDARAVVVDTDGNA